MSTFDETSVEQGQGAAKVAVLERARWQSLLAADDIHVSSAHWLALEAELLDGATSGVVVLFDGQNAFAPAALWPDPKGEVDPVLTKSVEAALSTGRPSAQDAPDGGYAVACCIGPADRPTGAAGFRFGAQVRPPDRSAALRALRLGTGWLEALSLRQQVSDTGADASRVEAVLDGLATVLDAKGFRRMAEAAAVHLALRLDCEMVAIGFRRRSWTRIEAVSHAGEFKRRVNLMRDTATAMDEAIDQACIIKYPAEKRERTISQAHRTLAKSHEAACLLTVPFAVGDHLAGAFTFERREGLPFDQSSIDLLDCVAAVIGPVLDQARREDRSIFAKMGQAIWLQVLRILGRGHVRSKLALLTLIAVVFAGATVEHDARVTSGARVEGSVQRVVAAPFEGYIAEAVARAGMSVAQGDLLARLDDRDLTLERLRWTTTARQKETEYGRALADGDRSEATVIRAQIDHAAAQLELIDEQIARTRLTAPFSGLIVSGDLSQSIGSSVARGEELFAVAPLDSYRVVLDVDERDVALISPEQTGTLVVTALPEKQLKYRVRTITPLNEAREGMNVFRVEAELTETPAALRPGMEGAAKTDIGRQLVVKSWTRRLSDWFRFTLWRWVG